MKKIFTKFSLLFIGLMLCAGNAWAATEVTHYVSGSNLYYVFNVDGVLYNATYTYTAPANPQIPVQCPLKGETVSVAGYSGNSNTITLPENVNLPSVIMIMQGNYMQMGEGSKKIYSIASDAFTDEDDFNGKTIQMPSTTDDAPALADTWGNTFCSGVTVVFPESEDSKVKYYNAGWPENKVWLGTQQGIWVVNSSTINWSYDNNGTLTLSGSGAMPDGTVESESIPWYGFKSRIKHVVIGNGITSICNKAFYECTQLQDVTIPNSITTIESEAFKKCSSLTTVSIDGENSNLETIGAEAFSKCSALTSVVIPAKVTSIGALAYIACYNVTSITAYGSTPPVLSHATDQSAFTTFDGQIVFLGSDPFNSSSTQTMSATVTMPSGKECRYKNAWGEITKNNESNTVCTLTFANAPEECPEEPEEPEEESGSCGTNLTWTYANHVLTISGEGTTMTDYDYSYETSSSTSPWASHKDDITEVLFDAPNLENIGNYAFYEFQNADFNEVTIPNSVVSVGSNAFNRCNKLTAIHLGSAVRTIGGSAFNNCSALTEPICNGYMFVKMPTSYSGAYTIQEGTVKIEGSAFSGCTGLTSVTIPNSVTTMGTYVFQNCSGLISATLSSGMTSIPNDMFSNCSSLASVTIPNSILTIGNTAFYNCTNLTEITMPASVTTIGLRAFRNSGLANVHMKGEAPTMQSTYYSWSQTYAYVFDGCGDITMYVPEGMRDSYVAAYGEGSGVLGANSLTIEEEEEGYVFSDEDASSTASKIENLMGQTLTEVTTERPVQLNDQYNTLCLPFSMDASQIAASDLAGAEIFAFTGASLVGDELEIYFEPTTTIAAGVPYFFKFAASGDELEKLDFASVTFTTASAGSVTYGDVTLIGTLSQVSVSGNGKLYLAANNELHWSASAKNIPPFRAYFSVAGLGGGAAPKARIVQRDNTATGVENVTADDKVVKFFENGQIFIRRGNEVFNVQGQIVK